MEHSYDLIVIGGGPAGGAVASPCSEAGLSVAMLEKDAFGGVCPLRGCNPKKVLLGPAELRAAVRHLAPNGLEGELRVNWPQLMDFVHSFTRPVPDAAENAYQMKGIETYHGAARFLDAHRVQVGEDVLHGKYIAICTGRVPRPVSFSEVGPLPTSNEFLELEELPRRIACIGGGVVALELASLALHAGATVHLLHRSERLLRGLDLDCVTALVEALGQAGMDIRINTSVLSVTPTADGLLVVFDQDGTEQAVMVDALFNFAGREADVAGLDLAAAGLQEATPGAFRAGLPVTPTMQTAQPHLFAAGDCAATPFNLTPSASLEGAVTAANIIALHQGQPLQTVDYRGIPSVCFSIPPVASVGLSQAQAEADGVPHRVKTYNLANSFPWKRLGEHAGLSKVILDEDGDRLLGAHLVGHNAEEMINTLALAIRAQVPLSALRQAVWVYPTCGYYLKYLL
ncbi:dihydrolipoyl dehydrogenase family protein [Megalodesulfovibrio gigas]|uniref:Putative Dihydropoyl dehydrogenase n=1 Tax=Megalodesulfovibrio gigas (strain ATCC 19364 / DSM 1382 / NCIMB 9332 / VKM B-1759) TaxID=1121448 RepID=T2G868_MEGG1|nr:NAD(P)/FAD-dependent oxidoreductase [Megalodesulfovibrio gigas]AGW12341.1 putative Dihydropoyl dehydrogenase [Megalodesulfovibrio gigas DSM 1382 = ATCC 19364]